MAEIGEDTASDGRSLTRGRLKLHLAKLRWLVRGLRAPVEIREILMHQALERIEEAAEKLTLLSDAEPTSRRPSYAERDR